MAIVKQYMSGSCKVAIDDSYIINSKDNVDLVLKDLSQTISQYFSENPEDYIE